MKKAASAKTKLTLSVDEEVVGRAKDLGLNLSDVTEKILRGFVFVPSSLEKTELYSRYEALFGSMRPLMKDYDASVLVAHYTITSDQQNLHEEDDIYLLPDGTFLETGIIDETFSDVKKIPSHELLSPKEILSNFVTALAEAKKMRKDRLAELEMAKRVIDAMTITLKRPKGKK